VALMSDPSRSIPYSAERLLRLCKTWGFQSDVEDLPDCDDGEPKDARAYRRIASFLRDKRDRHGPTYEPWCDETKESFHVSDVAMIFDEYRRLRRLEERVIDALGPETVKQRWNKKTGNFELE
jgi:hypothetical protein